MNPDTPGQSAASAAPEGQGAPAVPPAEAAPSPAPAAAADPAAAAPVGAAPDAASPAAAAPAMPDVAAPASAVPVVPDVAAPAVAAPAAPDVAAAAAGAPVEHVAQAAADHSLLGLVIQAGPVVQGVMGALVLASVVCWAIMIEKGIVLAGLRREIRRLSEANNPDGANGEGLAARIQRAAAREWADGRDHNESRGEYRERIERAMRETLTAALRRAQTGTAFLATTGAVAPFVGLFGTVWGIMGSFQGIAQMRDTSLAVVAPGIAEALLATAIGLFAAIPAVIGYNRIARRMAGLRAEGLAAISAIGARLSARPPRGGQARAAE